VLSRLCAKLGVLWLAVEPPPRVVLIPGRVEVRYCATDVVDDDRLRAALALLSDEERGRQDRFRVDRDRREFAVAHALLRVTLSEFGDKHPGAWRFTSGSHGKPMLPPDESTTPLSFNISHTHGLVACAVAVSADVGLDVERVTRATDWQSIATRYFSPEEVAAIEASAESQRVIRFYELWTLKEAFAKAVGLGLSQALDAAMFDLEPFGRIGCRLPPRVDEDVWQFALYTPTPEHRCAVAVSDGTPRCWRISVREGTGALLNPVRTSRA
jgi:4'-phosphopantetheinyl transferase